MCNISIFLTRKHEKQSSGYNSYDSYLCECTPPSFLFQEMVAQKYVFASHLEEYCRHARYSTLAH
jgi:hypothetical protein